MAKQSGKGMKRGLHLLSEGLVVYKDYIFKTVVKILLKLGFFEFIERRYCSILCAQRALFVQTPINNKTIRIATSVINIVSILYI
jgi:hypothetical protein